MDQHEIEEKQLRSVALRNAQSILLARQRAEEELIRAKEALELKSREFAQSVGRMRATLESTTDGILVTAGDGMVTDFNEKFVRMWQLPPEALDSKEHLRLLEVTSQQFEDARTFLDRIDDIYATSPPETYDLLKLADGRVIERFSRIQFVDEKDVGRVWSFRDISEQKRAEQALRESEAQLRMVMDHAPVLISRCDKERRYRFVNRFYAERLGLRPEEIIGRHIAEVLGPEAFEAFRKYMDVVLSGQPIEFEVEVPYREIGRRLMRCAYEPERDMAGEVRGWVAILNDITDRKQALETKAFLGAIVESQDAIVSKSLDGIIRSWNTGAEHLFGYSANEAIGRPITMIIPPERYDEERLILERLKRGERTGHFETVRLTKTGRRIDISLSISPVNDGAGRIIGASKIARDITAQKRSEQATRFLADASSALAELTDYSSTLQRIAGLAVPYFADWCAVDMREADGSVLRLAVTHAVPEKVPLVQEIHFRFPPRPCDASDFDKVLQSGRPQWRAEISDDELASLAQDDDHLRVLKDLGMRSYICVPLKSRGKVLGVLSFVMAESGRVYCPDDLRAAEDLAHRAVIAIENANLMATLRDSDQRKDEFLAMLAHELRNPLAPIRNAVEILRAKGPPVPELQWAREVIDRQVQQMTRLVDDLLDVSRITMGRIDLRRERVDLATVVNSAVEASRPLIEKWGHELEVTIPSEPILLHADLTRLSQVFLNLLNNAAKYMEHGGRIWLSAERKEGHVLVRVRDVGMGIPPEMLSRIFDMFTQLDRSLERSRGGLGIGLTLVKRLVEMHGGSVEARSDGPGKGSELIVTLPVAREEGGPGGQRTPSEVQGVVAPKLRILVVDDNRDAADSLGMLFRMQGNEVHIAHDGLEAVGAAAAFRPDVVLMDIGLPKLNGYEAARRIREQHAGENMVLIALTGWGQEEDRRKSKEAGFDQHLTKPVDFNALQALLAGLRLRTGR